ncbi:DUF5959 family protein [Streptomyces cyaneofuscatus]|uniref:DUF5959 family protein n=1 Tax=Streptomyces cyaneofuscatus TaxID=66883 RepID=UPI00343C4830
MPQRSARPLHPSPALLPCVRFLHTRGRSASTEGCTHSQTPTSGQACSGHQRPRGCFLNALVEDEEWSMVTVRVPLVPPDDWIADHRRRLRRVMDHWVPMLAG